MDHTLVKGRQNVETEYRLAAVCYNLTRVVSIIGIDRLKKKLEKLQKGLFCVIFRISCLRGGDIRKNLVSGKKKWRLAGHPNMGISG